MRVIRRKQESTVPRTSLTSPNVYTALHQSPMLGLACGGPTWSPPCYLFGLSPAGLRGLPGQQALAVGCYPQAWLQG